MSNARPLDNRTAWVLEALAARPNRRGTAGILAAQVPNATTRSTQGRLGQLAELGYVTRRNARSFGNLEWSATDAGVDALEAWRAAR